MSNLVYGTVCETQPGKALVKVNIKGRVTDWIPVGTTASGKAKMFSTPTIGQQVVVGEFGDGSDGVVLAGVFGGGIKEPPHASEANAWEGDQIFTGNLTIYGNLKVNGDVEITGNLKVGGNITDSKGDLTNFTTTDGAKRA